MLESAPSPAQRAADNGAGKFPGAAPVTPHRAAHLTVRWSAWPELRSPAKVTAVCHGAEIAPAFIAPGALKIYADDVAPGGDARHIHICIVEGKRIEQFLRLEDIETREDPSSDSQLPPDEPRLQMLKLAPCRKWASSRNTSGRRIDAEEVCSAAPELS